ncbi:hypothetical protein FACS18942_08640 [Planctomycetales bacterium]|nr:hypothetical protein FACS18942_08640 [Planctomycetales bacterium]
MSRSLWHPAFFQALQAELIEFLPVLEFVKEYKLTKGSQRIDVVVKKQSDAVITKNIGRIFRTHNIFEYKSPKDILTRDDFYKTLGYCFSYADKEHVHHSDITMSLAACKYPAALFDFLRDYPVNKFDEGIYYVGGWTVPIQIIVSEELQGEDYILLTALSSSLAKSKIERTFSVITERRRQVGLEAYFEVFVNSNFQTIEEIENMRSLYQQAVKKWLAEGKAEGIAEGKAEGKVEAILDVLQSRFKTVPKSVQGSVRSYTDLTALRSLLISATTCQTIKEFKEHLAR